MFKKQKPTISRADAADELRAGIDKLTDAAIAAMVDRRDAASILESAAEWLRRQDLLLRPIGY